MESVSGERWDGGRSGAPNRYSMEKLIKKTPGSSVTAGDGLAVAILDYCLRVREERRIDNIDVLTLWAQAYDMLKDTLSLEDVDQALRAMDQDFLIAYAPDAGTKNIHITVTRKGEVYYRKNRHLLGEVGRRRTIRRRGGDAHAKTPS